MANIPLFKSNLDKYDFKAMTDSLKTGWLTHGKNNLIFEKNFAKYIGTKYAISMNSCTSALECALKVIKKKGEVIIPSWTWVSTANAVINTGNIPVFIDVDLNSRNVTADEIKKKINKKTIAVIVVHYSGLPCDMGEIVKITKKKNIELIEDSAETLGAKYKNKQAGSFGTGCFSFFPTKNITTTEGGMLTTNNKKHYIEIKKIIAHGIDKSPQKKFWHRVATLPGHNFRLPNHLAALGNSQLKKLNNFNSKRRLVAKKYNKFFLKYTNIFEIQKLTKFFTHSYQMYSVLVNAKKRNSLLYYLKENGVDASVHFDPPLHKQKYLKKFTTKLINTDKLAKEILTLPIYPELSNANMAFILKRIEKWVKLNNS
jgi:perosamine synthetase